MVGCTPATATLEPNSTSPVDTAYPDQNDSIGSDGYPDPALSANPSAPAEQSGTATAYPDQAADPGNGNDADPTPTTLANLATPTPRAGLEASDPAEFALASGDLQLVEFFAFW